MTCKAKRLKCDEKKVSLLPEKSNNDSRFVSNAQRKVFSVRDMPRTSNGRVLRIFRNKKRMPL
jgi:hypothetical protein